MANPTQGSLQKLRHASKKTRVQNTNAETTVKATAGILQRIVITNANAAVQTLTVTDGSTTLGVFEILPDKTETWEFGCVMDASIKVTPSSTNIDALVVWD